MRGILNINCYWGLRYSPSVAVPLNRPVAPRFWCTPAPPAPASSACSAATNIEIPIKPLVPVHQALLCPPPSCPASANSGTLHKHRCGITRTPAGESTTAEKCFRCDHPPQNRHRAGHPAPPLPPSRSVNPAVCPRAALGGKSAFRHTQSRLPAADRRGRSCAAVLAGATWTVRQIPFLIHRRTAVGVTPRVSAMALNAASSPYQAKPRSLSAALGRV